MYDSKNSEFPCRDWAIRGSFCCNEGWRGCGAVRIAGTRKGGSSGVHGVELEVPHVRLLPMTVVVFLSRFSSLLELRMFDPLGITLLQHCLYAQLVMPGAQSRHPNRRSRILTHRDDISKILRTSSERAERITSWKKGRDRPEMSAGFPSGVGFRHIDRLQFSGPFLGPSDWSTERKYRELWEMHRINRILSTSSTRKRIRY